MIFFPQDPILFSDTIRKNLDPFETYNDDEIWLALESASLKSFFEQQEKGLDFVVHEGGSNLRYLLFFSIFQLPEFCFKAIVQLPEFVYPQTLNSWGKQCTQRNDYFQFYVVLYFLGRVPSFNQSEARKQWFLASDW